MGTLINTSEIVESVEESDSGVETNGKDANHYMQNSGKRCSIEDDINRLFQGIDIRTSSRDALRKSAMKRPIRPSSSQVSGIGISEPVSLKQALRGLCVSQAAETAAMKRLSRSTRSSGVSESGTIKKLYRAVVVEADGSSVSINVKGKGNLVEFTLVPDPIGSTFSREISESLENSSKAEPSNSGSNNSYPLDDSPKQKTNLQMEVGSELPKEEVEKLKSIEPSSVSHSGKKVLPLDESKPSKSNCNSPRLIKPLFRTKSFVKKKAKLESSASSSASNPCLGKSDTDLGPATNDLGVQMPSDTLNHENMGIDKASLESSEVRSSMMERSLIRPGLSSSCNNRTRSLGTNSDETSRFREKGEFSQSSKSSIGDFSSSPSISGEIILSWSSRSGNRAHLSKDLRWEAIHHVQKQHQSVGFKDFKILRRLGLGDIGSVYLAELSDTRCLFALKVMDMDFLTSRKKILRAQTEKEILQILDHPFLPTLYAHFETDKQSCLVIDYCPGGDLHVLRQKQHGRNFSEQATRFYVAEILLALEYLHMLGVVYRDLKPENILVREDGHIMLTDFDLSLRCTANTMVVLKSSSPTREPTKKTHYPCDGSSCIDPFCLQPSWQVPCFTPRLLITSTPPKTRKMKSDPLAQVSPLPQLVVEPTGARSNSFVGTYEYLAPEIIKNDGHGSAVDWWTYGIFLFELLYGKTPFKGPGNDETLANIVSQSLRFPNSPIVSFHARDLIRALLVKEPENRLGSVKGAVEIKQHPFFDGLNWALIRCAVPPELPKFSDFGIGGPQLIGLWKKDGPKQREVENMGVDDPVFEMF